MGQRPKQGSPAVAGRDYKYQGIKDINLRPHEQCEQEEDNHVVYPTVWPPQRIGNQGGDPYVSLQCVNCGAWCLVHKGHYTGEMKGIRVVLPEPAAVEMPERRGPGRPRKQQLV
jgi:hypothetical protein